MSAIVKSLAAALVAALTLGPCAQAQTAESATPSAFSNGKSAADDALSLGKASKMRFGQLSGVPSGYYDMCVSRPNLCRIRGGRIAATQDGSVLFTSATMDQLNSVNARVNATIHAAYRDEWTPEQPVGDCKDFAMTKRQRLVDSGWPTSALPVAIVRTFRGEQHLILVARTSQGDFVLDNLTDGIVSWDRTSYTWEKIQSTTDAFAWRKL
jgi:predicted transglutaminase-like cysteine proteinase